MYIVNDTTAALTIYMHAGSSFTFASNEMYDLESAYTRYEIANSDVPFHIDNEHVRLYDGDNYLSKLNSLRWAWNSPEPDELRDRSGKLRVHETSRPLGVKTFFAGAGDDPTDVTDFGGGQVCTINHLIGGANPQYTYMDLNIIENETWVHEGYLIWKDALMDTLTCSIVPRVPTWHFDSTASTDYALYGGYMIVPIYTVGGGPGDGTLVIDSDLTDPTVGGLVYMPNDDRNNPPTAFWNADYNTSTHQFENITPAPTGNGRYNIFALEISLTCFANKIPLLGSGFERMQTADTDQMGHGMRFRLCAETQGDHNWSVSMIFTLYRDNT